MGNMVTVICMAYNHENYIEKTLQGFVSQKVDFDVEYIVRDDASTDKTADIIRKYEKAYPGLIKGIYEQENQYNKPESMPISQQLILATDSKYYAFCEGDDYWCDECKLKKQVNLMESNPSATLCIHAHYLLNDKTGRMKAMRPYKKTGIIAAEQVILEPYGMPATCSMLMRGEAIKKYPYNILPCPVGDRNRRAFLASIGQTIYTNDLMSVYRINNSQSFGGKLSNYNKSLKLVQSMNEFYDRFNEYTGEKYSKEISLVKEREWISHYMRFEEYDKILETKYYQDCFRAFDKVKLLIKWKLRPCLLYTSDAADD